jgi:hypothetical protein
MRKASCKVTTYGANFLEIESRIKKAVQAFLAIEDDNEFEEAYLSLEINIYSELASAENKDFFGEATFTVPNFK